MRKLSYIYTAKNGAVSEITSFAEVRRLVAEQGGTYDPVVKTIEEPYVYTGKRVRPIAKAPVEK